MTQSRKPAGSPGGAGGQFDTDTTGGTGDLPALGQLPDDDLPEVKADFDDPSDISVPGLEGKTRGYLRWEGGQASVGVTTVPAWWVPPALAVGRKPRLFRENISPLRA